MSDTQPVAPNHEGTAWLHDVDAPFPEWAEPPAGAPIRQGDVLSAVGDVDSVWRQMLVVITADCDLARAKHDGALTCVPVLPLQDYLLRFRYERMRDALLDRLVDAALRQLRDANADGNVPNISRSRMRQWLTEEALEGIIDALASLKVPDRALELLKTVKSLAVEQPSDLSTATSLLSAGRLALGDFKNIERARNGTASDLASSLTSLPGDVLLLTEASSAHSEGYAVYLRRAFEVPERTVVRSFSRMPHDAAYARISRLRSPYVYALTQQFGAVYSAIGLPSSYERARESIGARIKAGEY